MLSRLRQHLTHLGSPSSSSLPSNMGDRSNKTFVGAIDNGTTSTRFLIFDPAGNPVADHQIEFEQHYPHSGWHEHDPQDLVSSVVTCIDKACASFTSQGHSLSDIKAVGITNQRETTVVWDVKTGEPLYNAIVWTDTRSAHMVRELKQKKGADGLMDLCGLPLSTYPSSTKLLWMLRHVDKVKKAYDEGRLAFGTVDTWLVYKLNGGVDRNVYVTDATNASRTMWMNIHKLAYDDRLISFFDLDVHTPKLHLPKIVASSDPDAYGALALSTLQGVKITGCLGDQSAALVGQCGFSPGRAKNTYGTGCFLLYNVGETPVISTHGLLATVAYDFSPQGLAPVYALEGSIAVAGSSVKFLVDKLGFGGASADISALAGTVADNGGCVFVTAFSGLFAPYWYDDVQGTVFGLTGYTEKGHIARATLEATCFQTKAILDAMEKDAGVHLKELAVDGGMSNSDLCMQTQSDIIQIPVDRPRMRETTALGAAIAAGFAAKVWSSFDELREINAEGRHVFEPQISPRQSDRLYRKWNKAVEMCRGWADEDDEDDEEEEQGQEKGKEKS